MKNEPAFPCPPRAPYSPGLTKLEYFSALAMQGLLSSTQSDISFFHECDINNTIAVLAKNHAKALIAELEKQQ